MKACHIFLFLTAALVLNSCTSCGPFWQEDGPYYKTGIITGWEQSYVAERKDTICDHCSKWDAYSGRLIAYDSISLSAYLGAMQIAHASEKVKYPCGIFFSPAFACDPDMALLIDNPIKKMEVFSRPSYSTRSSKEEDISGRLTIFYSHHEVYFPEFLPAELDTLYYGVGLTFKLLTPPADTNKFIFSFKTTLADNTEFIIDTDTLHLY